MISRRTFAQLIGAAAGATAMPLQSAKHRSVAPAERSENARSFPANFIWGASTAAYQIEGAVTEDGRGPSIWDTFSHTPGKTRLGDTGDVADDHFHRYKGDVQLMKDLGLKAYRFSISWPRIFPNGAGKPNPKGLDFYNRLLDELLAANIQPFCTLFHWDLPQAMQDKGGWENLDTGKAFADYSGHVAEAISDRVTHFMTMNEMQSVVDEGHRFGIHAPGLTLGPRRLAQLSHNIVLAHGKAVVAIRASARKGTLVGLAENPVAVTPIFDSDEHIRAATLAMRAENARFLTVIFEGQYPEAYLDQLEFAAPRFTTEELSIIHSPLDFVGLNIYAPVYVRSESNARGYARIPIPPSHPRMLTKPVGPESMYWVPKLCSNLWDPNSIYITENGSGSADALPPEHEVLDTGRVMFLRNYLTQLHRAVQAGVPLHGYFVWSLFDNFEWSDGYQSRYGIHYVDFKTLKRTPKLSASFYQDIITKNALD